MIKNQKAFYEHPAAGFDGIMNFDYITDAIKEIDPNSKITPTDLDCVVERNRHIIIIESKKPNTEIPKGQDILLNSLNRIKDFTVIRLWGKEVPENFNYVFSKVQGEWNQKREGCGLEEIKILVKKWFKWANEE